MERALFELCSPKAVSHRILGTREQPAVVLHLYSMTRLRSRHWGKVLLHKSAYLVHAQEL
jgi:hypothetical protein